MPLFRQDQKNKFPSHEQEMLLIDRISDEVRKVLFQKKTTVMSEIKSALFDIVVLTKLVNRIGVEVDLEGDIKKIRDSIAHVDERLDIFDLKPTTLKIGDWEHIDEGGGQFKISKSINFQGAIDSARVSTTGEVQAVAPYGMIDDMFIWVDEKGHQQHTAVNEIRESYAKFLKEVSESI